MASTEPRLTALKIGFKGEIHRIRIDLSVFKLEDLNNLFAQTFQLAPGSFVIQYKDQEDDCLNVTTDAEYVEACRVFLSGAEAVKSLRFTATPRHQVAFQENVADPILKAIEKLVETLNAAMEKVKQEEWAQKAAQTAQVGVEQTNEAFKTVARDARESFVAARQSIQEIPFEQVLKETAENIKTCAENFSTFAQEVVGELSKNFDAAAPQPAAAQEHQEEEETEDESEEEEEVAAPIEEAPVVQEEEQVEVAVEEETASPAESESEWEQVTEQAAPAEEVVVVAEPEPVAAPAPVVSEAEQKWAEQLTMIREIFPTLNVSRTIDFLEQARGNVQVVLNALMEEM